MWSTFNLLEYISLKKWLISKEMTDLRECILSLQIFFCFLFFYFRWPVTWPRDYWRMGSCRVCAAAGWRKHRCGWRWRLWVCGRWGVAVAVLARWDWEKIEQKTTGAAAVFGLRWEERRPTSVGWRKLEEEGGNFGSLALFWPREGWSFGWFWEKKREKTPKMGGAVTEREIGWRLPEEKEGGCWFFLEEKGVCFVGFSPFAGKMESQAFCLLWDKKTKSWKGVGRRLVCVFVEDGNEGCVLMTGRGRWRPGLGFAGRGVSLFFSKRGGRRLASEK